MSKNYIDTIVKHYEACLEQHGDTHLGVDWPKPGDAAKRYQVMLDVVRFASDTSENISLLDFGCGAAHLLQYIIDQGIENVQYSGLEISEKFAALCKNKFPHVSFYQLDILESKQGLPTFDYIVMNGVFTERREMSFEEMWEYCCKMLVETFSCCNKGIAFNVMSKEVDWEREDLFHMPTDLLINFLVRNVTRNFIIRNDYGLYEYTVYIYR